MSHHIRASLGFRHGQSADVTTGDERGQVSPFLVGIAVASQLVDAEIRMRAVAEADRGRGAAHFLHRDAMFEITKAQAAEFLFDRDAVQAELAHPRPEVARKNIGAIDLGRPWGNLLLREGRGRGANLVGGLAKGEIEAKRVCDHERSRSRKSRRSGVWAARLVRKRWNGHAAASSACVQAPADPNNEHRR